MSPICFVVIFVQTLLLPVTDLKEKRPVASYGRPFLSLLGFSYPHTAYRLTTVSILRYATTMLLKIRMLSFAYYLWIILFRYCFVIVSIANLHFFFQSTNFLSIKIAISIIFYHFLLFSIPLSVPIPYYIYSTFANREVKEVRAISTR